MIPKLFSFFSLDNVITKYHGCVEFEYFKLCLSLPTVSVSKNALRRRFHRFSTEVISCDSRRCGFPWKFGDLSWLMKFLRLDIALLMSTALNVSACSRGITAIRLSFLSSNLELKEISVYREPGYAFLGNWFTFLTTRPPPPPPPPPSTTFHHEASSSRGTTAHGGCTQPRMDYSR